MVKPFKGPWIVVSELSFLCFVLLVVLVEVFPERLLHYQSWVHLRMAELSGAHFTVVMQGFTHLGDFSFCLMLSVIVMFIFFIFKQYMIGGFLFVGLVGARLIGYLSHKLMARLGFDQTPFETHFPSGDMLSAVLFYGFLFALVCYVLLRNNKGPAVVLLAALFSFFLFIIVISHLYLKRYEMIDLVGGLFLGTSWLFLVLHGLVLSRRQGWK